MLYQSKRETMLQNKKLKTKFKFFSIETQAVV